MRPVAMPQPLLELLEAFVAEHHVEEPFVKRQRQKHHQAEEHKFGQEPIEVLRKRAAAERARMNEDEPFLKRWSRRKVEARERPDEVEPRTRAVRMPTYACRGDSGAAGAG